MIDSGLIFTVIFLTFIFSLSTGNIVGSLIGALICGAFSACGAKLNAAKK